MKSKLLLLAAMAMALSAVSANAQIVTAEEEPLILQAGTIVQVLKPTSFGLELDMASVSLAGYQGSVFGVSAGLYWLRNFTPKFSWKVLNARLSYAFDSTGSITFLQLMTGIRWIFTERDFLDVSAGLGSVRVTANGMTGSVRGAAIELGGGTYMTNNFYLTGFLNVNTTPGAPFFSYGVKLGWEF